MSPTATQVKLALKKLADPERASSSMWFFKTGKGQYGEGDVFLGIRVPAQREVAKKFKDLTLPEIKKLLQSKVHEHRFTGLEILVMQYEQADKGYRVEGIGHGKDKKKTAKSKQETASKKQARQIVDFYLKNAKYANNWDLVDTSAPYILGGYLSAQLQNVKNTDFQILHKLAKSKNLWERRISIVATLTLVDKGHLTTSLELAKIHLKDEHDLMHKAVGWVLREVGKKDINSLLDFLDTHATKMPRTTLRYAIERLPKKLYNHYLNLKKDAVL